MSNILKKKFLVTGGTGLIGTHLITNLLSQKCDVFVLTRNLSKVKTIFGERVTPVADLNDIPMSIRISCVVNLAGEPIADKHWSIKQKEKIWNSRVDLTQALVKWISRQEHPPEILISGSAVGWYGDQGLNDVTEKTRPHEEFSHKLCDAWEKQAKVAEQYGVRVSILRTGLVLSKDGGVLKKLLPPFKLGLGSYLGKGQQYMPWIHIEDVIDIILLLSGSIKNSKELSGVFNVTAPDAVTNNQFTQCLAKILNRPVFIRVPAWILNTVLGERARLLLTGQNAKPQKLMTLGYRFKFTQLSLALENLLK